MKRILPTLGLCIFIVGAIILPACSGPSHNPISVTITSPASPPTIQAGQTANITASVANDSASKGVTWALTGAGSLSAQMSTSVTYNAPPSVGSNTTVTVTATSVSDNTKSASINITVTPVSANNNSELNGQYAFLVSGFDDASGEQFAYIGSFTANGSGGITTGIEDENLPSGAVAGIAVQGSYTLGNDNRGTITLANAGGLTKFAFSAGAVTGGVATKLHIIEFDDTSGASGRRGSGVAYLQTAGAFNLASITGPYAFEFAGQDGSSAGARLADVGSMAANGTGGVTGTLDSNASGTFSAGTAFTATIATTTQTATFGRVTFAITGESGTAPIVYIASGTRLLLMDTAPVSSNGIVSGEIVQQTSASFANSSLNGTMVLYSTGLSSVAGKSFAQAGVLTFDSTTLTGTISLDTDDGGTPGTVSTTFTYSVAADGNVAVTPAGGSIPDLFLIDTNKAFMMGTGAHVNAGMLDPQSAGPFANSSVSGNYFFGEAEYVAVTGAGVSSGIATSTGNGSATATVDESDASGTLTAGQTQSLTLTLTDATTGRFTDNMGDILYIISATKFVSIESAANDSGVLEFEQ